MTHTNFLRIAAIVAVAAAAAACTTAPQPQTMAQSNAAKLPAKPPVYDPFEALMNPAMSYSGRGPRNPTGN